MSEKLEEFLKGLYKSECERSETFYKIMVVSMIANVVMLIIITTR